MGNRGITTITTVHDLVKNFIFWFKKMSTYVINDIEKIPFWPKNDQTSMSFIKWSKRVQNNLNLPVYYVWDMCVFRAIFCLFEVVWEGPNEPKKVPMCPIGASQPTSNTYISLWEFRPKIVFIGPESDHWECLSVTHSLTHWLTAV